MKHTMAVITPTVLVRSQSSSQLGLHCVSWQNSVLKCIKSGLKLHHPVCVTATYVCLYIAYFFKAMLYPLLTGA